MIDDDETHERYAMMQSPKLSDKSALLQKSINDSDIIIPTKQHIDISWQKLSYSISGSARNDDAMDDRVILSDVSGYAAHGEVLAILGQSGSGKTSLINILSCRLAHTSHRGTITANGLPYDHNLFNRFGALVTQNDLMLESLTPHDIILFAARLKLFNAPPQYQEERLEEMIQKLGLKECRHTQVGGLLFRGISGGEKKRTAIAVALLGDPKVLVLDEPTSGLDSFNALKILRTLKNLANEGKTILLTIHQPGSELIPFIDRILLLANGDPLYQGRLDEGLSYFEQMGYRCPMFRNPFDFLLSVISLAPKDETFLNNYRLHIEKAIIDKQNHHLIHDADFNVEAKQPSVWYEYRLLTERSALNFYRNPMLFKARVFMIFWCAVIINTIYNNLGSNPASLTDIMNRAGGIFFLSFCNFIQSCTCITMSFPMEREIFYSESSSKLYRYWTYYFSKLTIELPSILIFPVVLSLMTYWCMGLNTSSPERVIIFILNGLQLTLCSCAVALTISSLVDDMNSVLVVTPLIYIPYCLLSGMFVTFDSLMKSIQWVHYINPMAYSFEILIRNEFEGTHYLWDPVKMFDLHLGINNCFISCGILTVITLILAITVFRFQIRKVLS